MLPKLPPWAFSLILIAEGIVIGNLAAHYYLVTSIRGASMSYDGADTPGFVLLQRTSEVNDDDWACFVARNVSICHICSRVNGTLGGDYYCYGLNVLNSTKDIVSKEQIYGKIVWTWLNPRAEYPAG